MLVTCLFLTIVGCQPVDVDDSVRDPQIDLATKQILENEEKNQALLANLHKHVSQDVDRINAKLNRPGEPGVVPSSLMQIDDPTDLADGDDSSSDGTSDVDALKASFGQMNKDRAEMRKMDKEAKEELHGFRRGEKEAKKMLNHIEIIRDLRHKKHLWREKRANARVRGPEPSSFLEEKNKKAAYPLDASDGMLKQFMAKMTEQKQEYDEERKEAEEETRKARAEIARANHAAFPSSLAQTFPDVERSDNLGDVEKTLGQLQGRMRQQLNQFTAAGRTDQREEDLELKRMKRAFPLSFAETSGKKHHVAEGERRPHFGGIDIPSPGDIDDDLPTHHHHHIGGFGSAEDDESGLGLRPHHSRPSTHHHFHDFDHPTLHHHPHHHFHGDSLLDKTLRTSSHASTLVHASPQPPVLDDSKLNADLAAFSDATNQLGKEENQMKTDAAKFAADMDAATVNAGSDDSAIDTPSSLAEMGETTALSEWRKHMAEQQRREKKRSSHAVNVPAVPSSLLQVGSGDLPDFGGDDLDSASSVPDVPSFDHSDSPDFTTPDFSPPSDTDSMSPSSSFGDSSLDDPITPSTDFGGSTFGHDDASSFDSGLGSSDSGLGSSDGGFGSSDSSFGSSDSGFGSSDSSTPDFSTPDFSTPSDSLGDSSFTPTEPSADFGSDDSFSSPSVPSFGDSAGDSFDTSSSLDDWHPSSLVETKTKTKVDTKATKANKAAKATKTKAVMAKRIAADDTAHLRRK